MITPSALNKIPLGNVRSVRRRYRKKFNHFSVIAQYFVYSLYVHVKQIFIHRKWDF